MPTLTFLNQGLDDILPTRDVPCLPKLNKDIYLAFGAPIDLQDSRLLELIKGMDDDTKRSYITEYIRTHLIRLRRRLMAELGTGNDLHRM